MELPEASKKCIKSGHGAKLEDSSDIESTNETYKLDVHIGNARMLVSGSHLPSVLKAQKELQIFFTSKYYNIGKCAADDFKCIIPISNYDEITLSCPSLNLISYAKIQMDQIFTKEKFDETNLQSATITGNIQTLTAAEILLKHFFDSEMLS